MEHCSPATLFHPITKFYSAFILQITSLHTAMLTLSPVCRSYRHRLQYHPDKGQVPVPASLHAAAPQKYIRKDHQPYAQYGMLLRHCYSDSFTDTLHFRQTFPRP